MGPSGSLFAQYLADRDLAFNYGELIGGRPQDFSVFACARSFVAGVHDPALHRPVRPGFASSYSVLLDILSARGPVRRQIASVRRAGLPYAAIVGRAGSAVDVDPARLARAMFSDPDAVWAESPGNRRMWAVADEEPEDEPVLGRQLRGVSAVAVMQYFNPTLWRVERAWAQRVGRAPSGTPRRATDDPDGADRFVLMSQLAQRLLESGALVPDARLVRLIVLHNPFARHPLDVSALAGPHDEQWTAVDGTAGHQYARTWTGPRLHEVRSEVHVGGDPGWQRLA
jgi:hypothetical protein